MNLLPFRISLLLISCFLPLTVSAQIVENEQNNSTSTFGIIMGYNESLLRESGNYYNYNYYKDNFTNQFRGYLIGISYNKKLTNFNNFATFTIEASFQTLPIYDEERYEFIIDTTLEHRYRSATVKSLTPNRMLMLNSLFNINVFKTGFFISFGGSFGYIFNRHFTKRAVVDNNIEILISKEVLQPIEPVVFGKEIEFTTDSRVIKPLRFTILVGLSYMYSFQNIEIEPFVRYSHSLARYTDEFYPVTLLHGFQTGLSVRFPF